MKKDPKKVIEERATYGFLQVDNPNYAKPGDMILALAEDSEERQALKDLKPEDITDKKPKSKTCAPM